MRECSLWISLRHLFSRRQDAFKIIIILLNKYFFFFLTFLMVISLERHLNPKGIFFLTCRRTFTLSTVGWSSWKRISSLDTEMLPLSKFHFLSCWVIINYVTVTFCKVSSVGGSESEVRECLPQKWTCQGWSLAGFGGHGKGSTNDKPYFFFLYCYFLPSLY